MKNCLLVLNLLVVLLSACKKDITYPSNANDFISFDFEPTINPSLKTANLNCEINDTLVTGMTGDAIDRSALVASFTTSGASVTVNGVEQTSGVTKNDFTSPVVYTVTSQEGTKKEYTVKLASFTGLPVVYITTVSPVVSKDDYVNGTMKIDGNLLYAEGLYNGNIQIKGRGNSTWYQDKKPYKIKLASKSMILGMPADKEWALLADYLDKTLMRNDVGYELSERLQLPWTPRRRFVEVFMNNEFLGNYLLCETVKTSADRVNITPMDETKPLDTTGGYLFEVDQRLDGDQWFKTLQDISVVMKEPDIASETQLGYIKNEVQQIENDIAGYKDVRNEVDLDSWIRWVIVNEVMRNSDAVLFSSCFFYKSANKLSMGPVWDFDMSSGAYEGNDPEGWYINNSSWIGGLFLYHPYYKQRFKEIWNQYYGAIASINNYINSESVLLQNSEKQNFARWDVMNASLYGGQVISGSYQKEVDHLSDFLTQRINWINTQVNTW